MDYRDNVRTGVFALSTVLVTLGLGPKCNRDYIAT